MEKLRKGGEYPLPQLCYASTSVHTRGVSIGMAKGMGVGDMHGQR
jgi:hypothetical protein